MRRRMVALLACVFAAVLLAVPTVALALDFTPNARLDEDGVLHWDAEEDYYSRIDLSPLMFGPNSGDSSKPPVNGEYTYDIENLFQFAEQLYGGIGDGDVSGLNGDHPVTFVYYERQSDGTVEEVGRAEDAYSYTYETGQLVKLATPDNLSWTGDGFIASWDTVEHAEGYWVRLYETTSGGTSEVSTKKVEGTTCELTSVVSTPKDGATYTFEVRAIGPAGDAQYVTSDWSAKSGESYAWKTPVVEYGLTVGGIDVTSENAADVLGDGTVSYDPDTQTLTLNGATITQGEHEDAAIYYEGGDLAIVLKGDNVVTGPKIDGGTPVYSRGIYVRNGAARISGDGSLTVEGGDVSVSYGMAYSYGIWADGSVEILAGTVSATGGTVSNSNGTGGSYGVSANQDVIFSGGTVEVVGGEAKTLSYGAYAALGTITFAGGDVTATSGVVGTGAQAKSLALYGFDGVDVDPQDGEMVSVVAGATANDATELDGSPFESDSSIADAVSDSRYVKLESSIIPVVQRYGLSVGDIDVTSENAADVLGDGTVSYEPDTQTLTLNGATITNVNAAGCSIEVDPGATLPLTVALEGTNSCGPIMTQKGTTTISGSGNLTVTQSLSGTGQTGISVQDDLVIDGVRLTVNSNESGVHTNAGNVTIRNNAQVEVTTKTDMAYVALLSSGDLTVTGAGTSLKATTERNDPDYELSIQCQGQFQIEHGAKVETSGRMISAGKLLVQGEGSLLKATGTEATTYAVSGQDSIAISGGATVEATGRLLGRYGITVEDSTLDVESIGTGMAVYSNYGSLSFSDSTVTVTSAKRYALYANTGVSMDGGTITLEGAQGAIYVENGSVSFGSNPMWYQWATSPAGAVKLASTEPYSYSGDTSTYLRFEPAGTTYELTVSGGQGGGSYVAGTQAAITAEASNADGHFAGWSVTEDPTGAGTLADAEAASTTFAMPAANVTLTASYEAHTFSNGACTVCGEKDPGYVPPAPPHNPPASSGPDWDDVTDDISNAEGGNRVVVDMEGETELPGEVLEALAGSDVTLVLEMGDGVAWEIAGAGVPEDTSFSATDLGVSMGTSGIPVDVTNLVTGEHGTVQVALSHEGDFGFELALVAPLGEKNEGLYANLYHYDDVEGLLSFGSFGVVGEDGTVRLALTRASQLAIAIDVRSHELPFSDAGEGKWYSEPVRWAWLSGAMTGYGDGSGNFGPADALSRAQLAVVLWRLAGEPEGTVALPADCGEGEFYSKAVSWALGVGVFSGYESGSFGPADALTREQAATVLWRAAGSPEAECDLSAYPDAGGVSEFASAAVRWAVSEGVLRGKGDGTLDPRGACSRAELAALMMRLSAE